MASPKETHTYKEYSEEAKQKLQAIMVEVKPTLVELDELDKTISTASSPTPDILKEWARQAVGKGNYLRKKWKKLDAAATNEKDARYMEIKIECDQKGLSFTDGAAKIESEGFISPLRTIRNIFEAYVLSADAIISVCRMHLASQQVEKNNSNLEV